MPRDIGAVTDGTFRSAESDMDDTRASTPQITLESAAHVGEALRAAREAQGRTLVDIAEQTCVRRAYLEAIDQMRLEVLPSRPFVIGYIRAYADAVGLDPDGAVARFKQDNPDGNLALREPLGVEKKSDGRLRLIGLLGVVVFAAILIFNLVQRAMSNGGGPGPAAVADAAAAPAPSAPISGEAPVELGAPTPPPQESTRPDAYVTPGLDGAPVAGGVGQGPRGALQTPAAAAAIPPGVPVTFSPAGRIYGAPANASVVALQARKSAALIVHDANGAVVFGQQLKAGESYRVPMTAGLSVDVSDPAAFLVYVGGQIRPSLAVREMPVSKIAGAVPTPVAKPSAAARPATAVQPAPPAPRPPG
jgi:cytoskeleton protein RodZ